MAQYHTTFNSYCILWTENIFYQWRIGQLYTYVSRSLVKYLILKHDNVLCPPSLYTCSVYRVSSPNSLAVLLIHRYCVFCQFSSYTCAVYCASSPHTPVLCIVSDLFIHLYCALCQFSSYTDIVYYASSPHTPLLCILAVPLILLLFSVYQYQHVGAEEGGKGRCSLQLTLLYYYYSFN